MARPRWIRQLVTQPGRWQRYWDRSVALWAALNLVLVAFDLTYLPLRSFWLQRNLCPIPSLPLVLPLGWLPDVTPWVDPLKGIEPHRETQAYLKAFDQLDRAMDRRPSNYAGGGNGIGNGGVSPEQRQLLARQLALTVQMIDVNPFLASGGTATLETIKDRLRHRAQLDSAKAATAALLDPARLALVGWSGERQFWRQQVLPLVATNYWRSIDENGRPTDHFWRLDLLLFQSVFALDILLRLLRLRQRLPGLSWRDACLRRWIDLPLLLPFWRWLRLLPVLARLQAAGLVNLEPLRAVVSRAVVALLALELFEVLALQLLDGGQSLIRSARWPERIRRLRSHQSVAASKDDRQLAELVRIWAPLLLAQVAPRLAPEAQNLLVYALRQSLARSVVPPPLRALQPLLLVENGFSRQLATGMVDTLVELSRNAGQQLSQLDDQQLALLQRCVDRFWEELAAALERGPVLQRSQELLVAMLEELKTSYLSQVNRSGIEALIQELDQLTTGPGGVAGAGASGDAISRDAGLE
jgi:hypothetical protein